MRNLPLIALLASCSLDPSLSTHDSRVVSGDHTTPETLDASRADLPTLASVPLTEAETGSVEVLSVLASCALHRGESLETTTGLTLFGDLGLAPRWRNHRLTVAERERLTACLAARISLDGVIVPISLRGVRLATGREEREIWTILEGGFAGDVFDPTGEISACSGDGHHPDRLCAEPDPADRAHTLCGFVYAGQCRVECSVTARGVLRDCLFGDRVITVYDAP